MKLENVELTFVFDKEDVTALHLIFEMARAWIDIRGQGKSHGDMIETGLLPAYDKYQMKKVLDELELFNECFLGL